MAKIIVDGKVHYSKGDSQSINAPNTVKKPSIIKIAKVNGGTSTATYNPDLTLPIIALVLSIMMPFMGVIVSFISLRVSTSKGNDAAIKFSKLALGISIGLIVLGFILVSILGAFISTLQ